MSSAPDIPTVDEAGMTGFHFLNWHAVWAPRGTSTERTARLNGAVRNVLADGLADIGQQIPPQERQTARAFHPRRRWLAQTRLSNKLSLLPQRRFAATHRHGWSRG